MKIKFIAVGGTIDKIYFDKKNAYQVGEPQLREILNDANVAFDYDCESILRKDSLEMNDVDRMLIFDKVQADDSRHIIITHGTDTMVQTAGKLQEIRGKVIVLTGAMSPARFKASDAEFNLGCAIGAALILPEGVYIVMNGQVFDPNNVKKNVEKGLFEKIDQSV